jgi:hypothetical protein
MKRILTLLLVMLTAFSVNANCNWKGYYMKKVNQQGNVFTFQTNVDGDPCIDYWWVVYDYQLKRQDTIQDFGGITQVQLNVKGKYRFMLKATNTCDKCDTTFNYEINITIFGKADVISKVGLNHCRFYNFELTNMNDTCTEYYYTIYKSLYFDTMSKTQWERLSDSAIYFGYNFDDKDLVYYNMTSQRIVTHEFTDSGRHLLVGYWYNKCTGIDTWIMRKMVVCPTEPTSGITRINKSEPKLIGIYDMLGRPVYNIRENEILIYIYSDGTRRKVYKTN